MQVEVIKTVSYPLWNKINKGEILNVRDITCLGQPVYQVTEGKFAYCVIPKEYCKEYVEKTYTEKQWNDLENYYLGLLDREREQKERAQKLVKDLTDQINKKNDETERLNFFVNILSGALRFSIKEITKLKELEKANNG